MFEDTVGNSRDWQETSALAAPALLGAAAGLLLGELMHRNARRGVALGLGALGVAALAPWLVGGIASKVNGPATERGARRRLERIRDAGAAAAHDVEDELREQGLI
jgi:uncharacterized membrane protein YebE (DUF533 family)